GQVLRDHRPHPWCLGRVLRIGLDRTSSGLRSTPRGAVRLVHPPPPFTWPHGARHAHGSQTVRVTVVAVEHATRKATVIETRTTRRGRAASARTASPRPGSPCDAPQTGGVRARPIERP